jgi:hypothetical protein
VRGQRKATYREREDGQGTPRWVLVIPAVRYRRSDGHSSKMRERWRTRPKIRILRLVLRANPDTGSA